MHILIVKVSAIGDAAHTLPAIRALREAFPRAKITWLIQKKAAAIAHLSSTAVGVVILQDNYLHPKNIFSTYKVLRELRTQKWDLIIDFQGIFKTKS